MEKATFWNFTIIYILYLITNSLIIIWNTIEFFNEDVSFYKDKKEYLANSYDPMPFIKMVGYCILSTVCWYVVLIPAMALSECSSGQRKFLWGFIKSPFGLLILCIDAAIVAAIIAGILFYDKDIYKFRLVSAENRGNAIQKNIKEIQNELEELEHSIKKAKDKQMQEVYKESYKRFEEQLRSYEKLKRENADLKAMLNIKINDV